MTNQKTRLNEDCESFPNPYPEDCVFFSQQITEKEYEIHPLESVLSSKFSSNKRKLEFLAGRECVQALFNNLGFPKLPIYFNKRREPLWPFNCIGSISHGASIAAAIVGKPGSNILGLGIDIEDLTREIRTDITRHVLTPWEIKHWKQDKGSTGKSTRTIFSIKETIYKCFYPVNHCSMGFQDAEVIEIKADEFLARLLKCPFRGQVKLPLEFIGKVYQSDQLVFTALRYKICDQPLSYA